MYWNNSRDLQYSRLYLKTSASIFRVFRSPDHYWFFKLFIVLKTELRLYEFITLL